MTVSYTPVRPKRFRPAGVPAPPERQDFPTLWLNFSGG